MITKIYAQGVDLGTQYGFGGSGNSSLGTFITPLIPILFTALSIVVIFYFLYAALKLILSAGEKSQVAEAKAMITHSIIGVILLIMLFSFLQFLPKFFGYEGFTIIK